MSIEKKGISRKTFLKTGIIGGIALTAGLWGWFSRKKTPSINDIPGEILGASAGRGHKIRGGKFPAPETTESTPILIVGGGIAGLSASWKLRQAGITDFILLDLEDKPGGNSTWGENELSPFPWGAHYLPIPHLGNTELIDLLVDLKAITGFSPEGLPIYDPYYLCFEPKERLKIFGRWQPGITPALGVPKQDAMQIKAFKAFCAEMETATGADGKPVFTLPLANCSDDPKYRDWDAISMEKWLQNRGWTSPYLTWYVNYCCRDDYGANLSNTSAWAGIHYFAARTGTGVNAPADSVLTWPQGNGWLAQQLANPIDNQIRTGAMAWQVKPTENGVSVSYFDFSAGKSREILAENVILATPHFVNQRICDAQISLPEIQANYAPWVVANIQVNQRPNEKNGAPLCWDNVLYNSPSIGYVVADHQQTKGFAKKPTTLTWYYPLSEQSPVEARKSAYEKNFNAWRDFIVKDMEEMHPGITKDIARIDVWVWGHGMISPQPGYLSSQERLQMQIPQGNVHFAHSDQSGISIFEEAFYQGCRAASEIIEKTTQNG